MAKRSHTTNSQPENRLLAALPGKEFDRLTATMDDVALAVKDVLYRPNGPIRYVYFPRTAALSIVLTMADGGTVEVGSVGNEGMAGVPAFLDADRSPAEVFCQVPGEARRMPVAAFREEVRRDGPFRDIVQRYTQVLINQVSQTAACNRPHPVEGRLARWLLITHDRVVGDVLPLTQEFLSYMLGSQRPTVTLAAQVLQRAGLIRYTRGKITIQDRKGLETASCECYDTVRAELDRLVP